MSAYNLFVFSEDVMYYEEKLIDGKWYWRGLPDEEFRLMNTDLLNTKIERMQLEINKLKAQLLVNCSE